MKKRLYLTPLVLLLHIAQSWAYDFCVDGIYYDKTSGSSVVVTKSGLDTGYCGHIVIPDTVRYNELTYSVTSIDYDAFTNCTGLESISLPSGIRAIESLTFSGCTSLKSISLPNSVTYIGSSAFAGCTSLKSLSLPGGITTIKDHAFYGCASLTGISWPSRVAAIETAVFQDCRSLTDVILPESLTTIGNSAFKGCVSLASLSLPNSVTSIKAGAFDGCTSLESISLPSGITAIEGTTFLGCTSLARISLPSSIQSISASAFNGCNRLAEITLPESLTYVGDAAFVDCPLQSIRSLNPTPPSISYGFYAAFDSYNSDFDVYAHCKLYVPAEAIENYKTTTVWKRFVNILPLDDTESAIPSVEHDEADACIRIVDSTIQVVSDEEVRIVSVNGTTLFLGRGEAEVTVGKGVYVVTVGNKRMKVIVL